jgi:hypothetical protein
LATLKLAAVVMYDAAVCAVELLEALPPRLVCLGLPDVLPQARACSVMTAVTLMPDAILWGGGRDVSLSDDEVIMTLGAAVVESDLLPGSFGVDCGACEASKILSSV